MSSQTYGSRFEELLRQRVEEERRRVMDELEGGQAVISLESYRERVGYLRALRNIDEWCTDANSDLNKG